MTRRQNSRQDTTNKMRDDKRSQGKKRKGKGRQGLCINKEQVIEGRGVNIFNY